MTQPATPHRRAPKALALFGLIAVLVAGAPGVAHADGSVPIPGGAPTANAGNGVIYIWAEPFDDGGSSITIWGAFCDSSDGGASGSGFSTVPEMVTVTGVTNGKTYTCTARALNANGFSNLTEPSNSVVPGVQDAVPSPPGVPTVTPGDGSLSVDFTATNEGLSPISLYAAICSSDDGGVGETASDSLKKASSVVGATAHGATMWAVTSKGNVSSGPKFGTLVGKTLSAPIGGISATVTGKGYWIWLTNGATYAFGDAKGCASSSTRISPKVIALSPTPDGKGCWLTTNSGVVKAFGTAHVYALVATVKTSQTFVAMLPTATGHGYWTVTADGHIRRYGDATSFGTAVAAHRTDIVGLLSLGAGYRFATANRQLLTPH